MLLGRLCETLLLWDGSESPGGMYTMGFGNGEGGHAAAQVIGEDGFESETV